MARMINDEQRAAKNRPLGTSLIAYLAAAGAILFWASAFPAVRYTLVYFSPGGLMLYRFLIASIILTIYCIIKKVPLPKKRDLPLFFLSGQSGIFLYMWAFNAGTAMVTAGISGFIIAAAPVFTLILSILFLKERAGLFVWLGVLISFFGIIIIAATQVTNLELNAGIWLLIAAAISASFYNIFQKMLVQKYTAMQATAYSVIIGTVFMIIFAPALVYELPRASLFAHGIVIYLGIFPAAFAFFLWGYAILKAEKTVHVTNFLYLSPFFTLIIAFLWLGEVIPLLALVGGIVVILGMVITRIKRKTP